jgi:excinuclease UvrABC nuclease subunit
MNVLELKPTPKKKFKFSLSYAKYLPNTSGCYVLTNFLGEIMYLGLTINLSQRFIQHRNTSEKCEPTIVGRAHWFYFLTAVEVEINAIERAWQNQYSSTHGVLPFFNKISSPVK